MSTRLLRDYLPPLFLTTLAVGGVVLAYESYQYYQLTHPPEEALVVFTIAAGRSGLDEPPAQLIPRFQAACEAGYEPACSVGAWTAETRPDWRLQKMAIDLDARAEEGDPLAMLVRAWAVGDELWPGDKVNLTTLKVLEGSCEAGYQPGCVELGGLLIAGKGLSVDRVRAQTLFTAACDAGVGEGCLRLAQFVPASNAEKLQEMACRKGSAGACFVGKELAKACEGGHVLACQKAGPPEADSAELSRNMARCKAQDAEGCELSGYQFAAGGETRRSYERAAEQFALACELGRGTGCGALGELYNQGRGVELSPEQAAKFYQKAVDLGSATKAAFRLAELYRHGLGVTQNEAQELILSQLACNAMDGRGCYNVARLQTEGTTVEINTTLAQYNLRLACTLGYKLACK